MTLVQRAQRLSDIPSHPTDVVALEARDLYRFYHSTTDEVFALRGVSMTVVPGEMVAVVGPSGGGKSTLLNCLAGLDEPDGGTVLIDGEPITRQSELTRSRVRAEKIGILLQSGNLIEHLDVIANIRAAHGSLSRDHRRDAGELLDSIGLAHRAHARPSTLSGGEYARASLAVALANDPKVLLADEPTGEIDRHAENSLIELLLARANEGIAVVVVTHSERLATCAHRRIELADGKIVGE